MDDLDYEVIGFGVLIVVSALGGWLATRRMKRKLSEGLGREAKDEEVTSISAWMKADDNVVDDVINDHSLGRNIENAMEGAADGFGKRS